jgi:hypothetical protein
MIIDRMLVAGERMADEDRIAAFGIERAVGLVSDLQRAKIEAGVKTQRIIWPKANDQRMRLVRFTRAVGEIKRRAGVAHQDFPASRVRLGLSARRRLKAGK